MEKHEFETIFTYNKTMNIQDAIGKGFGSIGRAYYIGLNDCFTPRRTNRPHTTPNYRPGKYVGGIHHTPETCMQQSGEGGGSQHPMGGTESSMALYHTHPYQWGSSGIPGI